MKQKVIKIASLICTVILLSTCVMFSIGRSSDSSSKLENSLAVRSGISIETSNYQDESSSVFSKWYIHSNKIKCEQAKKQALSRLDKIQIQTVQDIIRIEHFRIEWKLIGTYNRLKSSSDPMWETWEHLGPIQLPESKSVSDNQEDGDTIINQLEQVKKIVSNTTFQSDIETMQNSIREAVKNYDVKELITYHEMIHDCDYWIVTIPLAL